MKNFFKHWFSFWFGWDFTLTYASAGYFDCRPRINIGIVFFHLIIKLPFKSKWTDECDPPEYGIKIHNRALWFYLGGNGNWNGGNKTKSFDIPFVAKKWYRSSILLKGNVWEHEYSGNKKEFYNDFWKEKQEVWNYNFTDKYDGEIIPTKIYVEEREWRPVWLAWTKLFNTVNTDIDIHFSKEVGKRKGSWKGGTIGCSYRLLPNESPIDCIKRMEKERTF